MTDTDTLYELIRRSATLRRNGEPYPSVAEWNRHLKPENSLATYQATSKAALMGLFYCWTDRAIFRYWAEIPTKRQLSVFKDPDAVMAATEAHKIELEMAYL